MDRRQFDRPPERPLGQNHTVPPPSNHSSLFPPPQTAQPPIQIPFSDPFQTNRDPFFPGGRRDSSGLSSRAWPQGAQGGNGVAQHQGPPPHHHHHHHHSPPQQSTPHSQGLPPHPSHGLAMPPMHDSSRRASLGQAEHPQYLGGKLTSTFTAYTMALTMTLGPSEQHHPPPPSFPARNMPPPSPPQNASASSHHMSTAPRGPPTTSPFARPRDLSSHRPGMSISAILGGGEESRPSGSPHSSAAAPASSFRAMRPPSPGRARSSSMRESNGRGMKEFSPPRGGSFGETQRMSSEPRRDGQFASPQFRRGPQHSFRAFQPSPQENMHHANGHGAPVRPNSQPVETAGYRNMHEMAHREESRVNMFRNHGEAPAPPPPQNDAMYRNDRPHYHNGITSNPQERSVYSNPQMEREGRPQQNQAPGRYPPEGFSAPMREDPASLFRPGYPPTSHPTSEQARQSIEAADMRRQISRQSPPPQEYPPYERGRNGFADRPMTLEEHQRMETMHREQLQRKESDGSVHRTLLNLSPDLSRRGRNSPLPQAVQGAQPRHLGPGGNNPGIKTEFGRMFSGLGSGAGSSTPGPGHPVNGAATPSRGSPARHGDPSDMSRGTPIEMDEIRGSTKAGSRGGKRNGRRAREEAERAEDGRNTPDARGNKRSKTTHPTHHHHHHVHPHHHHYHRHDAAEGTPSAFTMPRAPSNPLSQANLAASQAHHHHHHHAHPVGHHHHHAPRSQPPPRMPSTTVVSRKVLEASAGKPRRHLGSQLYSTEISLPPAAETPIDSKIKFSSKSKPIPVFEEKENSTFTVRVPRYFLSGSEAGNHSLEEICKRRQLWGTEVYTDDSDVVAAAIHSGWLKGDFGASNQDIQQVCDSASEQGAGDTTLLALTERPTIPVQIPEGFDAHITVLVLPPLEKYASTSQHHVWSRDWAKNHDGMSFMIHSIEFVDEGTSSRFAERGAAARKSRMAMEEQNRREAAAGLLMFANSAAGGAVSVGA